MRNGSRSTGTNPRALGTNPKALRENPKAKAVRARYRRKALAAGVAVEPFYATEEWRTLRYKVLVRSDGRCDLCGRSKPADGVTIHVDHIKPRSKFPELAMEIGNLQVLCADCNLGKSNRDDTDWRARCL